MHEREADGKTVREYYCSACFARLFPEISFEPKSKRDEGGADDARGEKKERRCPFCGTGAREYYKTKLLGCPECYRYLFEEIKESVFAMQGDEPHRGKVRRERPRKRRRRRRGTEILRGTEKRNS